MARLRLTIHDVSCFKDATTTNPITKNLCVSTEKETDTAFFPVSETSNMNYTLNLVDFSFKKKMYQPTEIIAEIQLTQTDGKPEDWAPLSRGTLNKLFKFKQVTLEELPALDVNLAGTLQTIGDDFYVHEVLLSQTPDAMCVTLKIYSLDKLLTLKQASRMFVGKKLNEDILGDEMEKYKIPYNNSESVPYDAKNMKHLYYENDKEHIFPYLVQYNESFYDMLARTSNRWGEFMYYEDGKLNFGYTDKESDVIEIKKGYKNMTFLDLAVEGLKIAEDGKYDYAAPDESGILTSLLRKSPNEVDGILLSPGEKWDKVLMKTITAALKHDKNIPTFLGNLAFDSAWDLAVRSLTNHTDNSEFDDEHFPDENKPGFAEQYGDHDFGKNGKEDKGYAFNQFTELDSKFKSDKYGKILAEEQAAGKNAVCIDYDTTCPKLKLGNIIKIGTEQFIVVEISSRINRDVEIKFDSSTSTNVKKTITSLVFQVVATAKSNTDKFFYPAVIPAGHVRYSDPQIATITDASDPSGNNRVRVMFEGWQSIEYTDKKKTKITDDTKEASSPWLTFTAGAAGSPTVGKHYEKNKVLVGFVDGNIERPYVIGGVNSKGSDVDYIQTTPGGHQFKMTDDEDGIKNFLTGMFMPVTETLGPFLTAIPGVKTITDLICTPAQGDKNNPALGGGFEISDNYGIYKIAGSTDGREVSIASTWGEVKINAFSGITISAPNGDIAIKGKNIKLEAGNNVEIISGTNVKNKIGGGDLSGFGNDVAVAVAKKLADKASSIVDLSMVRSAIEIIFRPAEGALRIKSNRFLMLEAGKGQCSYPKDAYADEAEYNETFEDLKKNDFRKGLKLTSGVEEILGQITTIGSMHRKRFMEAYNKCVEKQVAFSDLIKNGDVLKYRKKYKASDTSTHKICHKYEDAALKDKLWADGKNLLTEPDLGFVPEYSLDLNDVTRDNAKAYAIFRNKRMYLGEAKAGALAKRTEYREAILKSANELREAIIAFKAVPDITQKDVETSFKTVRDKNLPKDSLKCLIKAFTKSKLGDDVFFYQELTTEQKKLNTKYTEASLKKHEVVLERKAAILAIEALGFKDEWREMKDNPNYGVAGNPTKDLKKIPKVDREFKADKLTNEYWENYVQTIVAVPKLNAIEFKAFQEFKKKCLDNFSELDIRESWRENDAWADAKKGSILFSTDCNMYNLKKNIEDVPSPFKENLTADDDTNGDVTTFLTKVKAKLNDIKY